MVHDSFVSSNCSMKCQDISGGITGIRLNNPVSEVDITKYQQLPGVASIRDLSDAGCLGALFMKSTQSPAE